MTFDTPLSIREVPPASITERDQEEDDDDDETEVDALDDLGNLNEEHFEYLSDDDTENGETTS